MVVQIRSSAIERAWRAEGEGFTWLLLAKPRHKDGADTAFERFQAAVTSSNDHAAERGDDNEVFAEGPAPTAAGFAVLLSRASEQAALRRFVEDLAVALEANGLTGSLTAAGDATAPTWARGGPVLAAFLAFIPDLDSMARETQTTIGWHVPADRTDRITQLAVTWAGPMKSRSIVRVGQHSVELTGAPTTTEVATLLARGVAATGMAGVELVDEPSRLVQQANLAPGGDMVLQTAPGAGNERPWRDVVGLLRDALTALPADLNQGFVRPTVRQALSVQMLDATVKLPGIREHHVRYNKHLLDRFIPDVHGIQVLRDEHLATLSDTRGWNITELTTGRYLVEAEDLEPWYADGVPDPSVLDAARAQFASVLLTPTIINSHPTPW